MQSVLRGVLVAMAASLIAACARAVVPADGGGADADSAVGPDSARADVTADTAPPLACHFVPGVQDVPRGGVCSMGAAAWCVQQYQAMVDAGVAYGVCLGPCRELGENCSPVSHQVLGHVVPGVTFCCGNGPACPCDQICWAPNATDAPTCVPRGAH